MLILNLNHDRILNLSLGIEQGRMFESMSTITIKIKRGKGNPEFWFLIVIIIVLLISSRIAQGGRCLRV